MEIFKGEKSGVNSGLLQVSGFGAICSLVATLIIEES